MDPIKTESLISQFIKNELCDDSEHPLTSTTNLVSEGIVDSIGIAKLIAYIESTFEMKIAPKDLIPSNFMSIRAIVEYLGDQDA